MDPQQIIFTKMMLELKKKGLTVYDGELPQKATYPFVYMGENQIVDRNRKGVIQGTVYQTIDVWHNNPKKRGTLSEVVATVKETAREVADAPGWCLTTCSSSIRNDNSTDKPLVRGIIELGFEF